MPITKERGESSRNCTDSEADSVTYVAEAAYPCIGTIMGDVRSELSCDDALDQALMQFNAIERGIETLDNKPAMVEIRRLLRQSGNIGFTDGPGS
jgi:hypothetical protein